MSTSPRAARLQGWAAPDSLFARGESASPNAFFLDSGPEATSGWSYLGTGTSTPVSQSLAVDVSDETVSEWPAGPFRGGWVGWFSYDEAAASAGARSAAVTDESRTLHTTTFLAFDHDQREVWAVASEAELAEFAARSQHRIEHAHPLTPTPPAPPTAARSRKTAVQYAQDIEKARDSIRRGDAYQLCLTTRFTVAGPHDAADVFLRLRAQTPAHHAAYIRIGNTALMSASPEQFVELRGGRLSTKPIKGTRPRGANPQDDARLAAELLASEKERAENVMIVDLMRNDLSRVCTEGSVRVDALWQVESYKAVHQLVSTVSGQVREATTLADVMAAIFPAGSMTGAPKLSAMNIVHSLEAEPRGIYAGCFGWVSIDGWADLAMTIRTVVVTENEAYVGAGGGITWGSIAAEEVAEVAIKARAPLAALGALVPAEWEQSR